MYVTLVAVMCKLMVAQPTIAPSNDCTPEESRLEEVVTTTDQDETMDFFACQIRGQAVVADWMNKTQLARYHTGKWRVARIKCAPGHYVIKGAI